MSLYRHRHHIGGSPVAILGSIAEITMGFAFALVTVKILLS